VTLPFVQYRSCRMVCARAAWTVARSSAAPHASARSQTGSVRVSSKPRPVHAHARSVTPGTARLASGERRSPSRALIGAPRAARGFGGRISLKAATKSPRDAAEVGGHRGVLQRPRCGQGGHPHQNEAITRPAQPLAHSGLGAVPAHPHVSTRSPSFTPGGKFDVKTIVVTWIWAFGAIEYSTHPSTADATMSPSSAGFQRMPA
jgi:hypothetical protein